MAKYVCDFAQVTAAGDKLCQAATEVTTNINTYGSSIESDLSSWTGTAKSSFQSSNSQLISTATADAEYINALGEFIKGASQSIQDLEDQLASLSI